MIKNIHKPKTKILTNSAQVCETKKIMVVFA